jgi:carboxyl-terminal processing protease
MGFKALCSSGLSIILLVTFVIQSLGIEAKLPEIDSPKVVKKMKEILNAHATYKEMTPELIKRTLINYIEELDPNKMYFIKSDIDQWINPSDKYVNEILLDYNKTNFKVFFEINDKMGMAIQRKKRLDKEIDVTKHLTNVKPDEFKDMPWVETEGELKTRLERIRALQIETSKKLNEDIKEKALQRIDKHQAKREEEMSSTDPRHRQQYVLSNVLKASASSLDTHTAYFTPDEAAQFMINVQQRLFGIGAQLRDDLNGFTVVKIIEGGPAANGKELKAKDRIIAVDGEPVVGMDIVNAVELIRGKENTPVRLTVIREVGEGEEEKYEEKVDITIIRSEVVLKESRYEISYEPYGDSVIGYVKLFSFYQDPESSSAADLTKEIEKLKQEQKLAGIVLDLRYNAGGMLSQAVAVTGMFITKGIVVGIKDNTGDVQYLRDLDGKMVWDGPLIVLINRGSASASEIVAQALQDYGRAIIVGDDHTFGKGTFQTFTLTASKAEDVNPEGEYKVTRGAYYTVSGKTPQLNGVKADIIISGPLSELDIGEKFAKYPLKNDSIKENFDDDLSDVPAGQRFKIRLLYKFDLQKKINTYQPYLEQLRKNAAYRIEHNKNYQTMLKEIKKKDKDIAENESEEEFGQNDLQLTETYNTMKDLLEMMDRKTR